MRTRSVSLACVFLLAILFPLGSLNPSIPAVHAQGTLIQLGQPVSGTLSLPSPEDWWGVNLPRGEINITLTIPRGNTADLAFSFSPFQAGTPLGVTSPSGANVVHNQVGGNETIQFVAPSTQFFLNLPFLVPGPTAIRVYSPSSNYGKAGSVTYTLTVVQVDQFASVTLGNLNSFDNVRAGTPVLYSINVPSTGAYNITLHANATASALWFSVTAYEGDFFLPVSNNNLLLGQSSMLLVLSTLTTYLIVTPYLNPSPSSKPLKGNVTINSDPLTTIGPGQLITASFSGPPVFYLANLPLGSYYNLTLTPSLAMTGRLDIFSPSWPGATNGDIASSASPGNGIVQKVRNLVIFYLSSYSFTNSSGYLPVAGVTISGPRPDKVLVRVSGFGSGTYSLKLDSTPFPTLAPNTPVSLRFSTTNGPFYSFYQAGSGPGAYTLSLPYTVTNSTVYWSSQIDLDGVIQSLGTFDAQRILRSPFGFLFGSTATQNQVEGWQAMWERDFLTNNFAYAHNTTMQVGFGTALSTTPYFGATIGPIFGGNSTYKSTLSYSFKPPTPVAFGVSTTDFLSGVNVNLYSVQFLAGSTYRLDASHISASEIWAIYDRTSGSTVPSLGPFLIPGVSTDPNQGQASDYFYFTAPATGTYYLAAGINPGPVMSGPPLVQPEEQYSFIITVAYSPPGSMTQLSVTLTTPSQTSQGQTIVINGTVTNTGLYNANNVVVTITLPGQLTTSQSLSTTIGNLAPGQSASFTWTLTTSGSGTATATIITSSDNAPQNVKTSAVNISATISPSPPFLSSTTGAALIGGTVAGIAAFAIGLVIGKKRKPKSAIISQATAN
jgi:hypothetical protein